MTGKISKDRSQNLIFTENCSFHNSFSLTDCWKFDTHDRPSFKYILQTLDDIARSNFQQMPDANFYSMQDDWKVEIDEMLSDIRFREEVKARKIKVEILPRQTAKILTQVLATLFAVVYSFVKLSRDVSQ